MLVILECGLYRSASSIIIILYIHYWKGELRMAQNRVDLVNIFQSVTQTLAKNQQELDQVDDYNHDHGTNMVQTFQTITNSLQAKQGKSARIALSYAAKNLSKTSTSGSGQLYAKGLTQAATKFKGKQVDF